MCLWGHRRVLGAFARFCVWSAGSVEGAAFLGGVVAFFDDGF